MTGHLSALKVWAAKRFRQYLLEKKFTIETDHKAFIWLHNVTDPSSRLLRWRLRLEQYKYDVQYVKSKENKAADCLSRLFPITSPDILSKALEKTDMEGKGNTPEDKLPNIKILNTSIKRGLSTPKSKKLKLTIIGHEIVDSKIKIKLPEGRVIEFSEE